MKKTLLMVATSALALTVLASAQPPGAKDTVVIKKDVNAPPKETLAAPGSVPKPKVTRDPFVNTGAAAAANNAPPPAHVAAAPNPVQVKVNPMSRVKPIKKEPPVLPPKVTVQGIVSSPYGNRAIIQSPNSTFLVKTGDKLGDYHVAAISPKVVTFSYKAKKFPIKLEDEFAPTKK